MFSKLLSFLALCLLVHCTGASSAVQWGPCDPSVVTNPALSCGFFNIPLDYQNPGAGRGRLAVVKANATGQRLGTVFFNPGGPGGSGLQALDADAPVLLNLSGGLFDIVSWDPRGVGSLTVYASHFLPSPVLELIMS